MFIEPLTRWDAFLMCFTGDFTQQSKFAFWEVLSYRTAQPQAFTYFMSQPEDIQSSKNMQAAFCERELGPNYR
jgi:hypothetical protein